MATSAAQEARPRGSGLPPRAGRSQRGRLPAMRRALTAIVPDPAPLAADEGEGKTAVGVHHGAGGRRTHGRIGDTNTLQDCVDQASHATDAGISTF